MSRFCCAGATGLGQGAVPAAVDGKGNSRAASKPTGPGERARPERGELLRSRRPEIGPGGDDIEARRRTTDAERADY